MPDQSVFSASRFDLLRSPITQQIGSLLFKSVLLPFNMQAQTQSNWCWAATSTSVSHFYWFFSHWTQCRVANGELGHTDCCNSPVPSACNVSWYLDRALTRTLNLDHMLGDAISFSDIKAQIDSGHVIGVRIGWSNGGGHFLCIRGYSEVGALRFVDVDDPIYGKSSLSLSTFSTNYQGSGTWTHTYFTKRWPKLPFILPDLPVAAIDRIIEFRPLLAMKRGERVASQSASDKRALSTPHHVYVANLNDVLAAGDGDSFPLAAKLQSQRVIETEGEEAKAFFDLDLNDTPEIQSLSEDPATAQLLQEGVKAASRLVPDDTKDAPELRFIRIPALYVEAFWLHYSDATRDMYVPIRGIGLFDPLKAVTADQFISTVKQAARERAAHPGDDTIAP
jgi:Papain-like cysteine protease AvrRpt2